MTRTPWPWRRGDDRERNVSELIDVCRSAHYPAVFPWEELLAEPGRLVLAGGVDSEDIIRHIQVDTEGRVVWAPEVDALRARADEAVALLRAIWHGEGPEKWPDPAEFRKRVEALVGPPPPSRWSNRFAD